MNQINWGIIGCGNVTEKKSGPAFNKVPNSRLVAVMRRDAEKAADYARRHQVPRWYSDASALINDPEVNAIYIATPPSTHELYTLQALAAGKPVYVEKPMCLDAAGARRMQEAAGHSSSKLVIAHYRRSQPQFLKIKSLLEQGAIGQVYLVKMDLLQNQRDIVLAGDAENWRLNPSISGGGLFHDLAPHQLDLMQFYFGEVANAHGIARKQLSQNAAPDLVTGHILFKDGVIFNGNWCFSVGTPEEVDLCEIIGEYGSIRFSVFSQSLTVTVNGEVTSHQFDPLPHVQQPMIEKVVDYFLGRGDNPASPEEAIVTMELLDTFTETIS